jgi:hypothetical protein
MTREFGILFAKSVGNVPQCADSLDSPRSK